MAHRHLRRWLLLRLDASNLHALARGCAILGAGGGGDPEMSLTMALLAVEEHGPVEVLAADELPADGLVLPCGMLGSPTLAAERIFSGDEGATLVAAAEQRHGARVCALMPYAIGGANGLLPVTWAARTGLPLVDADGMGRAFSMLHRQAMHLAGVPIGPVLLTDGRGNTLTVEPADDRWAHRLAGGAAVALGGVCAIALYAMTAERARTAVVAGSVTRALRCGGSPIPGTVLLEGRVLEVERRRADDLTAGSVTVQGFGPDAGRRLRLELRDELLLALEDGAVRAVVPDIISVLSTETGEPLQAEPLRHGLRVTVLATPAPDPWHSPAGLALAGPRAFGLYADYTPIHAEAQLAPS